MILNCIKNLEKAPGNEKSKLGQYYSYQMKEIQQYISLEDQLLKSNNEKVEKALRETVEIKSLELKVRKKFLMFLQHKATTKIEESKSEFLHVQNNETNTNAKN